MPPLMSDLLVEEYQTLVADLPDNPTTAEVVEALVRDGDWTARGAETILRLAQTYGTFVLRNALALANALGIEDGESGI